MDRAPNSILHTVYTPFKLVKYAENEKSNVVDIAAYKRRKKKVAKEPVKRIVIIPVENKICGCGRDKKVIRYEVREYYHSLPSFMF